MGLDSIDKALRHGLAVVRTHRNTHLLPIVYNVFRVSGVCSKSEGAR